MLGTLFQICADMQPERAELMLMIKICFAKKKKKKKTLYDIFSNNVLHTT